MGKKILKILLGIIIGLAVIFYFSYDYWLEKELKYQLSEIINKDSNSLYEYSFSKLNIRLMEGSVDLRGIKIRPTESAYDSLVREKNGLPSLLNLNMEEIELKGFKIMMFLKTGIISVKSLVVKEPNFEYLYHPSKMHSTNTQLLNSIFSDKFKEGNLENLSIINAQIKIIDKSSSNSAIMIHDLNLELTHAHIDSTTLLRFSPFDYTDIKVSSSGINIDATEDFAINSDSLIFDINDESILLKNFQINPKLNQQNFSKKYNVQKQWFAVTLDALTLNHIDFDSFFQSGVVAIGKVEVNSPNVGLYKDKSKPPPPFKRKLLPASAINQIPWTLKIDTMVVENGYITINETSDNTGHDSYLTLSNLNATILNFTNDSISKIINPLMEVNATTKVLGAAFAKVSMRFDLTSTTDQFEVVGNVGEVKAAIFNKVLEPMIAVRVTAGKINSINFEFSAMDTLSVGTLDADYDDIKLEVVNTDTSENNHEKRGLLSFAANAVLKTNNHKEQANYVQGIIYAERVQDKDLWPFFWHSIQSGLVSTLAPITIDKIVKQQQKQYRKDLRQKNKSEHK